MTTLSSFVRVGISAAVVGTVTSNGKPGLSYGAVPRPIRNAWLRRNLLIDGDQVTLIKDARVKRAGQTLKRGALTKSNGLTDDPREIDRKLEGIKGVAPFRGGAVIPSRDRCEARRQRGSTPSLPSAFPSN